MHCFLKITVGLTFNNLNILFAEHYKSIDMQGTFKCMNMDRSY